MTDYPTLDVYADAGGALNTTSRATETTFLDGYTQTIFVGRKRTTTSLEFTYSNDVDLALPLHDKLNNWLETNTPFYYRYGNVGKLRLYKIKKDSLKLTHGSGVKYSVTATLSEWDGLGSIFK